MALRTYSVVQSVSVGSGIGVQPLNDSLIPGET